MENEERASREDLSKKIDEMYGIESADETKKEGESMMSKFIKYLEQMRDRQAQRARSRMRSMID